MRDCLCGRLFISAENRGFFSRIPRWPSCTNEKPSASIIIVPLLSSIKINASCCYTWKISLKIFSNCWLRCSQVSISADIAKNTWCSIVKQKCLNPQLSSAHLPHRKNVKIVATMKVAAWNILTLAESDSWKLYLFGYFFCLIFWSDRIYNKILSTEKDINRFLNHQWVKAHGIVNHVIMNGTCTWKNHLWIHPNGSSPLLGQFSTSWLVCPLLRSFKLMDFNCL